MIDETKALRVEAAALRRERDQLQSNVAAARRECDLLRAALERIFGRDYLETKHPAGQDYVSKAAIAQARAALAASAGEAK